MSDVHSVNAAKLATQQAIFEELSSMLEDTKEMPPAIRMETVRDIAYAFRLTAGGAQPGSADN